MFKMQNQSQGEENKNLIWINRKIVREQRVQSVAIDITRINLYISKK